MGFLRIKICSLIRETGTLLASCCQRLAVPLPKHIYVDTSWLSCQTKPADMHMQIKYYVAPPSSSHFSVLRSLKRYYLISKLLVWEQASNQTDLNRTEAFQDKWTCFCFPSNDSWIRSVYYFISLVCIVFILLAGCTGLLFPVTSGEGRVIWHMFLGFHCGIQEYIVAQNKPSDGS